ncbi:MAG: hypothetical protein RLN63_06945 [Miltoncostaeaceae bacterium]
MSWSPQVTASHSTTRAGLVRMAAHVLARARSAATGRIGLRPSPGGVATPAFGDGPQVVRTAGAHLIVERGEQARGSALTTLGAAAQFAGVDLSAPLDLGHSTPPAGDPDAPLGIDADAAEAIARAFSLGQRVLDTVVARLTPAADPSTCQLWPEHFDLACDVAVGTGPQQRANLGLSPGDDDHPTPYLYLGPWGDERPGDGDHWNAPFGALLPLAALPSDQATARAVAWLLDGLHLLGAPSVPAGPAHGDRRPAP